MSDLGIYLFFGTVAIMIVFLLVAFFVLNHRANKLDEKLTQLIIFGQSSLYTEEVMKAQRDRARVEGVKLKKRMGKTA